MDCKASTAIKNYIKSFESFRSKAYLCPAGVWTIGWGTTVYIDKRRVRSGDKCTKKQAQIFFDHDIKKFTAFVNYAVNVYINQNQLDALISLVYNIGATNFNRSTLLKRLNEGRYNDAGEQFLVWCKAKNPKTNKLVVLKGLKIRRKKEKGIFNTPKVKSISISFIDKIKIRRFRFVHKRDCVFNIRTI